MFVLIKCFYPEDYDAADHAVIELTEDLILTLDKRLAQAKAMYEQGFYGTKWWDYTPDFIACAGPETVGSDMSEEDFEHMLESNCYVQLPNVFEHDCARMSPIILTICVSSMIDKPPVGGFYWTGTDKYIGTQGRVETYEMHEDVVDEWAELIGCTEILKKARKCRGVE